MHPHRVITPPTIYPIEVDAVLKAHCRINENDTDDDALLAEYIKASTEIIERYIGYPLMTQVIEVKVPTVTKTTNLTGNVLEVTQYTYYDGSSTQTVTDVSDLTVEKFGLLSKVTNEEWPSGSDFKFKCNAGYTVDNIPADIRLACRLLVMRMYEEREPKVVSLPDTVEVILDNHLLY